MRRGRKKTETVILGRRWPHLFFEESSSANLIGSGRHPKHRKGVSAFIDFFQFHLEGLPIGPLEYDVALVCFSPLT